MRDRETNRQMIKRLFAEFEAMYANPLQNPAVQELLEGYDAQIKELREQIEQANNRAMIPGPKGDDGHTPTTSELTDLITPLIPPPIPGKTPTNTELAALITPLIPAAVAGKSAYELAVANGFAGTQPEWLASLKGTPADMSRVEAIEKRADSFGQSTVTFAGLLGNATQDVTITFIRPMGSTNYEYKKFVTELNGLNLSNMTITYKSKTETSITFTVKNLIVLASASFLLNVFVQRLN